MAAQISQAPAPADSSPRWLLLAQGWHALLALGAVALAVFLWSGGADLALWLGLLSTIVLLVASAASGLAVLDLARVRHRGRLLSLVINYLGFLICLIGSLHLLGVFLAFDSLANAFARGLLFLFLIFIGYFISNQADRFPGRQRLVLQIGRIVMAGSAILFALAVGLLDGLAALAGRFDGPLPILFALGVLPFGLMIWLLWRRPAAEFLGAKNADGEMLNGFLFLSPNLLGFLVFVAGPLLLSLYVSFTEWDAVSDAQWVGLDNYAGILNLDLATLDSPDQRANEALDITVYDELTRFTIFGRSYVLGAEDKLFWIALGNTIQFVLLAVPLSVLPALFLAVLLNSKLKGMKFFRAVYFLPSVAAVVGIALVWQWLFNSTIGYINYIISILIDLLGGSASDPEIRWLSSANTALLAVVIMSAWQWIGFNTVLFLAGLQNIPRTLYEAATVDGASPYHQFWYITVPMLAPTTFFVLVTTTIQSMQVFEQVFILIPGQNPAGPNNSTLTMVLYLYQKGFQRFEQGYASAIAWVLFLLIFGATLFQFQRQRASDAAYES